MLLSLLVTPAVPFYKGISGYAGTYRVYGQGRGTPAVPFSLSVFEAPY